MINMRFFFIATVFAFAFSVHAAALGKRDVATCVTSLTAISSQLTVVTNGVAAYTTSQGYAGALTVHAQATNLESKIDSAASSSACCTGIVLNEADAQTVIAQIDPLTTQIEAALSAIVTKKPVFDSVARVTSLVKDDISTWKTKIDTLSACLVASTPADLTAIAQGYIGQIYTAFSAAIVAYA